METDARTEATTAMLRFHLPVWKSTHGGRMVRCMCLCGRREAQQPILAEIAMVVWTGRYGIYGSEPVLSVWGVSP